MLELIKRTIEPPYNARDLYSIFGALFIMLLIPLTVFEATKAQDDRTSAATLRIQRLNQDINIKITSPRNNDLVKGTVEVSIEASDAKDNISSISLYSGKNLLAIVKNTSPTNIFTTKVTYDTTKEKNGSQSLIAYGYNTAGEQNKSSSVSITLTNSDTTIPSVSFSNLKDGDYLAGSRFFAKIIANDETGVSLVSVYLDNTLQKQFLKIPYETFIDLSKTTPGNHTLSAKALDFAGNEATVSVGFYKGVKKITN